MSGNRKRAARQSRQAAKQRKAKGRAKHAAEFRCWADRVPYPPKPAPSPMLFAVATVTIGKTLADNPKLMERLFGERHRGPFVLIRPTVGD